MITVSHSGDIGDIIYCGPALRALATKMGEQIDLVIYPNTGVPLAPTVRVRQTEETIEPLLKLMRCQHYIGQARFANQPEGYNFDVWRLFQWGRASLAVMQLRPHQFPDTEVERAWIVPPGVRKVKRVIIHRSPRYHGHCFPWGKIVEKYGGDIGMVGGHDEHGAFTATFGHVEYVPTTDFAELAEVIAGCDLFIGNQSAPYAVAEGMKHNTIQETRFDYPDCIFPRENAQFIVDAKAYLPDLDTLKASPVAPENAEAIARPPLNGVGTWKPPQNGDDLVNHDPHWNAMASEVLR